MRTYEDNVEVINQLWQSFTPTHELRQLFRERLEKLDQAVLYEAIKQAKVENDGPWPAIKWFTSEYRQIKQRQIESAPHKPTPYVRNVIPDVDADAEKELVKEFCIAIEGCNDEGFKSLRDMILDKYDEHLLSSLGALRLCRHLLDHLGYVVGVGMSKVSANGDISPLAPTISF